MAAIDEKKIRRILVAIDSSKFASVVVEEAAKLATRLGSDVTILSVVNVAGLFAAEGEVDSSEIDEREREFHSLHKSLIERYFNHSAILIESKILHGDPTEKICEYAETIDILGRMGRAHSLQQSSEAYRARLPIIASVRLL